MAPENPSSRVPRVAILFPDDWAAYAPTLTRLVEHLARQFDVKVFVMDTGRFDLRSLKPEQYVRIRVPGVVARVTRKLALYRPLRTILLALGARTWVRASSHVIAVDADGACAATLLGQKFHYLSLEVGFHPVMRRITARRSRSIVIQTAERLQYQFGSTVDGTPVFYIQNSPSFCKTRQPARRKYPGNPLRLVYLGSIRPIHGLRAMLDTVAAWPEAELTMLGTISPEDRRAVETTYRELVKSGRITIQTNYIPEDQLLDVLERYDIGLCFYELRGWHAGNFNYISAPAGKMFNYFAAGLPVIASNLIGLRAVAEHGAGFQVAAATPDEIVLAAQSIRSDYERFAEGALRAADHFDFSRAASVFIAYLLGTPGE